MTYCLGIKVRDGLVGLSDTRISAGTNTTIKRKVFVHQRENQSLFIMTSGLRSVRDKAINYFQEVLDEGRDYDKLYKAANGFGEQIRRVAEEDAESLAKSGYKFNLNAIVGGQLKGDDQHKLFLLYPEGNWVEMDEGAPYALVGNTSHGKAILNRVLNNQTSLEQALKVGYVSFDSTRVSANDVEFPIDVVIYKRDSFHMLEHRYEHHELSHISSLWANKLRTALDDIPDDWMQKAFTPS